jgi:hypothetical protein
MVSEKELERSIIKLCRLYGAEVDEFSQRRQGRCHSCGRRIYAGSQQTKGIPDLRVVWADVVVWLEVKWEKNKPSTEQVDWMNREIASGRYACPVWSIDDAIFALARAGVPMHPAGELKVSPACEDYVNRWVPGALGPSSPADDLAEELGI